MKKTTLLTLLLALFIVPASTFAGDDVTGSITIGGQGVDTDGESARFDEYRDMSDGTFGDVELRAFRQGYYLDLSAESIGRDDQSFDLRGGRFGSFTYSLFYDEIPHHLSSDNRTFYNGVGGAFLTNTGVSSDPMRWEEVDFRRDRQSYGFDGNFSFGTPFYLQFGASEKNTDGIYPLAGNSTIGPFGRTTELPAPVNWDETMGFIEGGYRSKTVTALVKAEFSDFDNADEEFFWEDDFATNTAILPDATTLPPDNEYWKISGLLTYRAPFLSSFFALRGSFSQLESEQIIRTVVADDSGPGFTALTVEPDKFDGDVTYGTIIAAWSMSPAESLDLEVFFKYLDKNNDNTIVDFSAGGRTDETEIFDYSKTSAGLDGTYDLAAATALDFGYAYTTVDREGRLDNEGSDDNLIFAQLRNRSMARLELRGRYEYLTRDGDFSPTQTGDSVRDDSFIRTFVRRFDVADQDRHAVELEAATWMADSLGLAVEFGWEDSDYDATELGLQGLTHYDVYLTADYAPPKFNAGAYFGYENDETDLASRRFNPGDITDPAAGTTGSAFNWMEVKKFDTYAYGLYLEVPVTTSLTCKAHWNHSVVDGKADFSSGSPDLVNFGEVEDYTKQELEIDLVYTFTKNLSVTAGYIYEKFDLDDDQWDGYSFTPNSQTLLGGAYADSDYEANIGFLRATFSF